MQLMRLYNIFHSGKVLSGRVIRGSLVPALCWKCDTLPFNARWQVSCNL